MGEGTAPPICCTCRIFCHHSSFTGVINAPPVRSLCPPKYLVAECITRSAPKLRGCWQTGVAKVLSQATFMLCEWAMTTVCLISVIFNKGFEGVSIQIKPVLGLM